MALPVIKDLKALSYSKQLAFAYLTCERLYPNYVYFSLNFHFGDSNILRQAADFIFDSFFKDQYDKKKIDFFRKEVERNTPNPCNFKTNLASSALDACTALIETLNFLEDKLSLRLNDLSTFATDAVSMYIMSTESLDFNKDKDFQKRIDEHPLMRREIKIQSGIIAFLSKIDSVSLEDLQTLMSLQGNDRGSLDL